MVIIVYPSGAIKLEDLKKKRFVENGQLLNHYNTVGPGAAKIKLFYFKDPK